LKNKKIIWLLLTIGAIIWLVLLAVNYWNDESYNAKVITDTPSEFQDLFKDTVLHELVLQQTYSIKGRNPLSYFSYQNNYSIIVTRFKVTANISIRELIEQDTKGLNKGRPTSYNELSFPGFNFAYAWDSIPVLKKLIITLYGDSLAYFTDNRALSYCYLHLSTILFRYEENSSWDIMLRNKSRMSANSPIITIFLKKSNALYFLIIGNINNNSAIDKRLPGRILNILHNDQ
jgi:hypothetical protein